MANAVTSSTKKTLKTIFIVSAILIPTILVSGLFWVASEQEKNSSRYMTQHFDPKNASLFLSVLKEEDSWALMLASEEFAKSSESKQESIAKVTSEEAWKLSGKDQGYNKTELDNWFLNTAKNYKTYPIKQAKLTHNQVISYLDLSSTTLPKPNKYIAVLRALSSENLPSMFQILFWLTLSVLIVLSVLIGTVSLFTSKEITLFFKIVVFGLIVIIALEGWIIKGINDESKKIIGGSFSIFEYAGNYVSAKGTWRGVSEKIATPGNTAQIDCYKDQGICREADAEVSGNNLMLNTTTWNIKSWDEKEIIVEEENQCNTVKMVINYKDKAVTQIRTPKDSLPADCIIGGTKFITELVDGLDVAFPSRKTK